MINVLEGFAYNAVGQMVNFGTRHGVNGNDLGRKSLLLFGLVGNLGGVAGTNFNILIWLS